MDGISGRIIALAEQALDEWESGGRNLDALIDWLGREAPAERPAIASLLFAYFRRKAFIDELVQSHATKGKIKPQLRRILALAATQTLTQKGIAPESAVNVAVSLVVDLYDRGGASSFVNAVLRAILRERPNVPFWSGLPDKMAARWRKSFGAAAAQAAMGALAANPPLSIRIRRPVDEALLESLSCRKTANLPACCASFDFRECLEPDKLFASGLVERGDLYVQDPATSLSLSLAKGRIAGRLLDLCAAPGGKTIMLADVAEKGSSLLASDRSEERLALARENFKRSGHTNIETLVADATELPFKEASFNLVFADVPCSNTGVIRRRPDVPWRFSMNSLDKLTGLQMRILDSAAKQLLPGGALLYSTCSVEAEEGRGQLEKFLPRHPEFTLAASETLLPAPEHDGAFAALLLKS